MKNIKKLLSGFLALTFMVATLAGCINKNNNVNEVKDVKPYDDVRSIFNKGGNLSLLDLANFGENMITLTFNEKTLFPSRDKMPEPDNYQPEYILEIGKNPGLGIRSIHEQGITGKGVNIAIVDQPLYADSHPEYKGKIIEYKDFDCKSENSMHGPLVTSLLVGETIGTAPGAKVYYAAVPTWKGDATYTADAVDWIIEINKKLPDGEKIKLISFSGSTTPSDSRFINGGKYLESVKRAQEAGILILDGSPENGIIGACSYDYTNPEDITLCKPVDLTDGYPFDVAHRDILAPMMYRTTAEEYTKGDCSYQYSYNGGLSSAVPYAAGVLAMGWEIKPELTTNEMMQILFDTAYVDGDNNKYVYPTAFIEYLLNN